MASTADSLAESGRGSWGATVDRWIYVFMAALLVVTALAGFVPDSIMKIAAVNGGHRLPFPAILHIHAVLMGSWLLLLLAQTTLMASGQSQWHMQLGTASALLAPVILISGTILVPTMYGQAVAFAQAAPPELQQEAQRVLAGRPNIMLQQLKSGIVFPLCVAVALWARKRDAGLHKRMMILGTLTPMTAAFARLTWLPSTMPESPLSLDLCILLWLSPLFFWDLYRQRQVHKAYLIWFAAYGTCAVLVHLLWGNSWWQATAPRMLGFA